MWRLSGKSLQKGIVAGTVKVLEKKSRRAEKRAVTDPEREIVRLQKAEQKTLFQLQKIYEKTAKEMGKEGAAIFAAHQMLVKDEEYKRAIRNKIRTKKICAEYAVQSVGEKIAAEFVAVGDAKLEEEAEDVRDVSQRLIRNLMEEERKKRTPKKVEKDETSFIYVADELAPSDIMRLEKGKVLALVLEKESPNSHAAILARMLNVPIVTEIPLDLKKVHSGVLAVVDGQKGEVIFEPSSELQAWAEEKMREEAEEKKQLEQLKGKKSETLGGRSIQICGNISSAEEAKEVLENDGEGVGLFRSEFLYLGRMEPPTEEEQFAAFCRVAQIMGERKVIIRTMDLGADKQVEYLGLEKEENPAMGYRAIRICLGRPEFFKVQLRALLRAATYGNISILYPMITSVEEIERIEQILEQTAAELEKEGIAYRIPEQGAMIETPAAVMISETLAEKVDFFSIGTNDLTQYTLAVDRQNRKLSRFYQPHHEAVLRMIQLVVENGHKAGKWVGICGELAADPELTETFVRMGVDELSVAPYMVLKLRKVIRNLRI